MKARLLATLLAFVMVACAHAHAASTVLPQFSVITAGACPDDDGSVNAPVGIANYPTLISAGNPYANNAPYKAAINGVGGLGCKVAGVDYHVGVPNMTLLDPTTAVLPKGCALQTAKGTTPSYVNCNGNVTVSGYDFSLHGTLLTGNGTGVVTNNKFSFGPNCTDPVINWTGSLLLMNFTIDGTAGFGTCSLNQGFGSLLNSNPPAGGFVTIEYFSLIQVPQDGFDINQPNTGNVAVTIKWGIINREGSTGHPDGIQYCGGGSGVMTPNVIEHVTWYGNPVLSNAGVQPIHIEAQKCSGVGHIANTVVNYNTVLGQGTCQGGQNWPKGCSMNFGIACKQDDTSTNINFSADGNYIDWTGGITALTNGYGCPSATWGTKLANIDMSNGAKLPNNPP